MEEKKIIENPFNNRGKANTETYPGSKVADFFVGFVFAILYFFFINPLLFNIRRFYGFDYLNYISLAIYIIVLIILFFGKRKFFAWGLLWFFLLPLLLFGGCIILFRSSNF